MISQIKSLLHEFGVSDFRIIEHQISTTTVYNENVLRKHFSQCIVSFNYQTKYFRFKLPKKMTSAGLSKLISHSLKNGYAFFSQSIPLSQILPLSKGKNLIFYLVMSSRLMLIWNENIAKNLIILKSLIFIIAKYFIV